MEDIHFGYWMFILVMGLTLFFSVVCNICSVYVILKTKRLRHNVTTILLCNLAISDIVLSTFGIPLKLHDISHTDDFHEGQFICKVVNFAPVLCIMSSVYSLMAISVERFRAVVQHNKKSMSLKTCYIVIACIWFAAWLVSVPTIVEFSEHDIITGDNETTVSCGSGLVPRPFSIFNGVFLALVSYVIPLVVIASNYTRIALFLSRHAKTANDATKKMPVYRNRVKIVKMMIIVTMLFAICWCPYFVVLLISKITGQSGSEDSAGPLALVKISLSTFSTAYNVVLYVKFNSNFRNALKAVVCCGRFSKIEPENAQELGVATTQPT